MNQSDGAFFAMLVHVVIGKSELVGMPPSALWVAEKDPLRDEGTTTTGHAK